MASTKVTDILPVTFAELGSYGRMGNAMFQVAATVALAFRYNDDYIFPYWEYYLVSFLSHPYHQKM